MSFLCKLGRCAVAILLFTTMSSGSRDSQWDTVCQRALGGQAGAAVILDVSSGRVLGNSDPEVLARRVAAPGSTVKPFVLQLALERKRIDPKMTLACRRHLVIAGKRMDCSHPETGTSLDAADALALSCNSYFAVVGSRFQDGELEARYRELGFTNSTGLLPREAHGNLREAHSTEEKELLALGAAGVEVTPMELAVAYLKLARAAKSADSNLKIVVAGLRESVEIGLGRLATPDGMKIAGKTGTASDPGRAQTHAWFVGWAPAEDPKIVILVFLENGRGSTDAAVAARTIFQSYADTTR